MNSDDLNVDDVFGIVRDVPLNYVARDHVDQKFVDNLSRAQHIVIYGGSKQGKTCLRKHCLETDDYIMAQCSNKWGVADINANILKRAGYEVTQSTTKTAAGKNKLAASFKASVFGISSFASGEKEEAKSTQTEQTRLELDAEDVNDIISALKEINFKKYIVLEDFHYLAPEVQQDFSVELKAFHEASDYCFIIVGVWLEENRLIVYNGDLTGRIVSVDADKWMPVELSDVMDSGGKLLNISFSNAFKQALIEQSFDSVSIVQECCRRACRTAGIFNKQEEERVIGDSVDVAVLVRDVVNEQSGRYQAFLSNFADGFQETQLQMYRWLLYPVLKCSTDELEKGLKYPDIRKLLQSVHPSGEGLNPGNITQSLQSAASLQVSKNIKPIVLDYDTTIRRLYVVDRGFLIWRASQDQDETLEIAGLTEHLS